MGLLRSENKLLVVEVTAVIVASSESMTTMSLTKSAAPNESIIFVNYLKISNSARYRHIRIEPSIDLRQ